MKTMADVQPIAPKNGYCTMSAKASIFPKKFFLPLSSSSLELLAHVADFIPAGTLRR